MDWRALEALLGTMHAQRVHIICYHYYPYDCITKESLDVVLANERMRVIATATQSLGDRRKAHMQLDNLANNVFDDIAACLATGKAEIQVGNGCCNTPGCPIGIYYGCVVQAIKAVIQECKA
jgi:hypothetical protein